MMHTTINQSLLPACTISGSPARKPKPRPKKGILWEYVQCVISSGTTRHEASRKDAGCSSPSERISKAPDIRGMSGLNLGPPPGPTRPFQLVIIGVCRVRNLRQQVFSQQKQEWKRGGSVRVEMDRERRTLFISCRLDPRSSGGIVYMCCYPMCPPPSPLSPTP